MEVKKVKLYEFSELPEQIRKQMIDEKRWDIGYGAMEVNLRDRKDTLHEFERIFGIKVDFQVDYCTYWSRVKYNNYAYEGWNDCAWYQIDYDEVEGSLLLRFLNSKFDSLNERKTYWGHGKYDENGKYLGCKKRKSRIQWDSDYPLTGVCYDKDILQPIRDFLKKPHKNWTLKDLIEDCVDSFLSSWHKDYEYCCDNEDFLEEEMENLYEGDLFYANGVKFEGVYEPELEEVEATA